MKAKAENAAPSAKCKREYSRRSFGCESPASVLGGSRKYTFLDAVGHVEKAARQKSSAAAKLSMISNNFDDASTRNDSKSQSAADIATKNSETPPRAPQAAGASTRAEVERSAESEAALPFTLPNDLASASTRGEISAAQARALADARLRIAANDIADQLCVAVRGEFDFQVRSELPDETAEKLGLLINFVLDAARRSVQEVEERVVARTQELDRVNSELRGEIEERRRIADDLVAARDEAERANNAKSEFLSRMSHELRTPLNSILGFGQLLEMSVSGEEEREYTGYVTKAGHHLLGLINDVLDISKIETGHMALSIEPVNVFEVAHEMFGLMQPLADKRDVALRPFPDDLRDIFVMADHGRLKQVLLNLLSNAVKYNREGGDVSLRCEASPRAGFMRITISDTGIGIADKHRAQLFVPFERLGAERTAVEGAGVGLALSKRLVELMGGEIGANTRESGGSDFWFDLENAASAHQHEPHDSPLPQHDAGAAQHTLLYIEDNLINLRLIEHLLKMRPQVRLLSAMQGRLGLELAREHHPDLILLDLNLPEMSGEEVLENLQSDASTRGIPVVVLSADAVSSRIEHVLQSGARAYLTKPLDVPQFLQTLDAQFGAPA